LDIEGIITAVYAGVLVKPSSDDHSRFAIWWIRTSDPLDTPHTTIKLDWISLNILSTRMFEWSDFRPAEIRNIMGNTE
jgi:hypothetical protein